MDAGARRLCPSVALAIASGWSMTSVSAAAPALADRYGVSLSQVGVASGALWVTFALVQAPAGRLADRVPTASAGAWGAGAMAALNVVGALVPALWPAIAVRLVAGVVGGSVMVVAARSVTGLGPRGQGIVGGATAVGSTLAVAAVPLLEPLAGWRTPFVGNVVLALVALAVALGVRPVRAVPASAPPRTGVAVSVSRPLRRQLVYLSSAIGCSLIAGFALGGWAPTFLEEQSGLGGTTATILGSAVVGGSIVTRPLGGVLAHRGNFRIVWGSLLLMAVGSCVLATAPWNGLKIAALLLVGLCAGLPFAGVVDRAAALLPTAPGRAVGFIGTLGTLAGMAGVVAVGVAVDHDAMPMLFWGLTFYAGAAAAATAWASRARDDGSHAASTGGTWRTRRKAATPSPRRHQKPVVLIGHGVQDGAPAPAGDAPARHADTGDDAHRP